ESNCETTSSQTANQLEHRCPRSVRTRMFPQTPAARAAPSGATRFCSPALLNHCVLSYLWGATYAGAHAIAFDDELYYVSAMLHDIALTDPFDSHRIAFAEAGGDLASAFATATRRYD